MSTYSDKLRDPRWLSKRAEILNRDHFACQCCHETALPLQVHHLKYTGDPWDAPNEDLETLCDECHRVRTDFDDLCRKRPTKEALILFTAFLPFFHGKNFPGHASDLDELQRRAAMYGKVS